jgi:hypothetical protein
MPKKHKDEEADTEVFVEEERKPATEPWKPPLSGEAQPWRANYTRVPKVREGYTARWVREDLVEQRIMQGYTIAKGDYYGIQPNEEGYIKRRELVLMDQRETDAEAFRKRQAQDAKRQVARAAAEVNAEARGRAVHVTDESE